MTAFEGEAKGHLVQGLPFHKFYFSSDDAKNSSTHQSIMAQPHVRVMGTSAVVSYVRLMQIRNADGTTQSLSFDESRVWQLLQGKWRCVHFHRSAVSGY